MTEKNNAAERISNAGTGKPEFQTRMQRLTAFLKPVPNALLFLVIAALALTCTFVVVSEQNYRNVNTSWMTVRAARDNLDLVERLSTAVLSAETGQRGYLLTENQKYLEPLARAKQDLPQLQVALTQALANREDIRPEFDRLLTHVFNKFVEIETTVALERQGKHDQAIEMIKLNDGKNLMDEAQLSVEKITLILNEDLLKGRILQEQNMLNARMGILAIAVLNLVLLGFVIYYFLQDFNRRLALVAIRQTENERLSSLVSDRTVELNELSNHLHTSAERERTALARDLHDELGGILTSAKMDLEWLRARGSLIPDGAKRLETFSKLLDDAVAIKRRIIENLRPSLLDNLGLAAALEWYINENCTKGGIKCKLNLAEELGAISPDASIALFRIVQEGTTNMLRHADAKNFTATLHFDQENIQLILEDDGKGLPLTFNPAKLSHGLSGIRQRARALGGDASWGSTSGKGTVITITIPRDVGGNDDPGNAEGFRGDGAYS